MKAYWGVEVYLHAFLTSALDGGEWSASCPDRFTHRERAPDTYWIGGWVGLRAGLNNAVLRRKIPSRYRGLFGYFTTPYQILILVALNR
jgi:hypothetical protein